ncbi:hypothetical protein [uncultured Megasphaera sp.]|uniref:hypothetical protein n=1 Tax=uncultured Megasphaera sp. TaxID=165188 RepID=UPI00378496E1
MKWVRTEKELPAEGTRVLTAQHSRAVQPIIAVGMLDKGKWYIDEITRPVEAKDVDFWAPVAPLPHDAPIPADKLAVNMARAIMERND